MQNNNDNIKEKVEFLKKYFEDNIQDENIRTFILKKPNVKKQLDRTGLYIEYMDNIINLAFIFLYGSFQRVCIDSETDDFSDIFDLNDHNVSRVVNYLKDTFVKHALISDLIQFILTDVQFDMKRGEDSSLKETFPGFCDFKNDFNLIKYFKLISEWKNIGARYNYDENEVVDMFFELVDNMIFLRNYNLVKVDEYTFIFEKKKQVGFSVNKKYFDKIHTAHVLLESDMFWGFYILNTMEFDNSNDRLVLRYLSADGVEQRIFYASEEDCDRENEFWIDADPEEFFSEVTSYPFEKRCDLLGPKNDYDITIHTINYKYIKNLALSISDIFNSNSELEDIFLAVFAKKYPEIFKEKEGKISSSDWDAIIVMLLIEAGPTKVLQTLIGKYKQVFYDICKNLSKRISNPKFALTSMNKEKLDLAVKKIMQEKIVGPKGPSISNNKAVKNRAFPKAAAILIISSLTNYSNEEENVEENASKKIISAGNVYDNIVLLNDLRNENTIEDKIKYVSIVLGETFKYLLCFYEGVFAYGNNKAEFDTESHDMCISNSKIVKYQNALIDAFLAAAKKEADDLADKDTSNPLDTIYLMDKWVDLCKSTDSYKTKGLYIALGKHAIMNIADFIYAKRKYKIYDEITINKGNVDNWISFAIGVLEYFKVGSFINTPIDSNLFNAVYPFVSTYNKENENFDDFHTGTFSISIDVNDAGNEESHYEVSILTEFKYNLSEEFYCLPNILRSNKRWWIDPLLIDYVSFNKILNQE